MPRGKQESQFPQPVGVSDRADIRVETPEGEMPTVEGLEELDTITPDKRFAGQVFTIQQEDRGWFVAHPDPDPNDTEPALPVTIRNVTFFDTEEDAREAAEFLTDMQGGEVA